MSNQVFGLMTVHLYGLGRVMMLWGIEINIPTPEVNVYIGQEKLNTLITEVVNKRLGGL